MKWTYNMRGDAEARVRGGRYVIECGTGRSGERRFRVDWVRRSDGSSKYLGYPQTMEQAKTLAETHHRESAR
jgi:hypothetical protein